MTTGNLKDNAEVQLSKQDVLSVFDNEPPEVWVEMLDDAIDSMISLMSASKDSLSPANARDLYVLRALQKGFKELEKKSEN